MLDSLIDLVAKDLDINSISNSITFSIWPVVGFLLKGNKSNWRYGFVLIKLTDDSYFKLTGICSLFFRMPNSSLVRGWNWILFTIIEVFFELTLNSSW